jgi:TaqI-like C-terminal specificity domain/N-6 DNA Methylase
MPLFQQSVQKKFIAELDKVKVENAYQKLIAHFSNPTIQENIRNAKEEEYQEGFVRDLFVNVLGYVLKPQPDFNFVLEKKNEKDSKKADGAIIKENKPVAVVELKSVKTVDLQSVETQAFGYKNNQSDCVYIVTSNFQKIRFYIENAIEFEEFDLFDISKERFALLYLCLQADSILSDLPLRVKKLSLEKEESITNKLYADYSLFKKVLYDDLAKHNKEIDRFLLFKKTQKLLDRFLFIFFAEDKGLLPPNSVAEILNQWDKLNDMDASQPLYNRFKLYFGYLNNGHKGKFFDIFAYNGGLFAPDELLDSLTITDNILYNHCRVLAHYDYDTDVDTNILGHIFEHSLNEIDEVAARSEGGKLEKSKTKRKKDGIFYTPPYITKNMVDSTIGELCNNKKFELGIDSEALIKADTKKDRKILQEKIANYRYWLSHITILDPACGSGAFLNQALVFLIEEHRQVDSMVAMLFGDSLVMTDNVTEILENNIFGVDINEESIEIARLSLWLRTAKVGRKLNDLSRNIKIGNSLINDKTIAGDLAFDWKEAFPNVFKNGGFDVILGNPPYGVSFTKEEKEYLIKYDALTPDYEIYYYFITKGVEILKDNAILSYIFPNTFLANMYSQKFRTRLLQEVHIQGITDLSEDKTFEDAGVRTCILTIQKQLDKGNKDTKLLKIGERKDQIIDCSIVNHQILQEEITNWLTLFSLSDDVQEVLKKIKLNSKPLNTYCEMSQGLIPYDKYRGHSEETIKNRIWHSTNKKDETYKKELKGADISKYDLTWNGELWISYGKWLAAPRDPKYFTQERILIREIVEKSLFCTITSEEYYNTPSLINLIQRDKTIDLHYVLGLLNSKLIGWYHYNTSPKAKKGLFPKILVNDVRNLPIIVAADQNLIIEKVKIMLAQTTALKNTSNQFLKLCESNLGIAKRTVTLTHWYELSFKDFLKEVQKQKVVINLKDQIEWQEMFDNQKEKVTTINTILKDTTKAINKIIYELYELTKEDIQIIDNQ